MPVVQRTKLTVSLLYFKHMIMPCTFSLKSGNSSRKFLTKKMRSYDKNFEQLHERSKVFANVIIPLFIMTNFYYLFHITIPLFPFL